MSDIRLVLADVDGTLVTQDKVVTDRTQMAVRKLKESGIAFAITSGRPPRGMSMLIAPLALTTPIAAFNGGLLVNPDLSPIDEQTLPLQTIAPLIETIARHELDVWVYRGAEWLVRDAKAPHVDREQRTVCFSPTVVPDFGEVRQGIVKIVGVGDDLSVVARCEDDVRGQFGDHVSAARSQPYYLDVTHPNANKGMVVRRLSRLLDIAPEMIATVGDMPNDILMFALSGLSIAMGNSSSDVQRAARRVTTSNDDEGFANAIERYVL